MALTVADTGIGIPEVAILVLPLTLVIVLGGVATAATTYATTQQSATFLVGDAPRLRLNVHGGDVLIESGDPGRIAVEEQRSVGTITRAGAVAQLGQTRSAPAVPATR